MGYLLGAFAKQMAGKRVRSLQARMVHVQSQLRRATRDIEQREKYWAQVIKDTKNNIQAEASRITLGYSSNLQNSVWDTMNLSADELKSIKNGTWDKIDAKKGAVIAQQLQMANNQNAHVLQSIQATMQQTLSMQEQEVEARKEADLQVLKDEEDRLQTEKDSLESQIQLAQADYEACKEMEKAGVKALTPNYTGQA